VGDDETEDGIRQAALAVGFEDVDIAEIGEGRVVTDHAGEADLLSGGRVGADAE
jgi:hypothetical protein